MDEQERSVDSQKVIPCVKILAEACEISKSIHNQRMEVERFEKSKSLMKSDSTFERYIFQKNEQSIASMEKTTTKLRQRLKALDDNIITQTVDKLTKAMNYNPNVDLSLLLPKEAELRKAVDMPTHLKSVKDMKQKIDVIAETKLDKGDDLRGALKEVDEAIRSLLQADESELETRLYLDNRALTTLMQSKRPPTPEKLFDIVLDETLYRLFGTVSERKIRNTCDVEAIVKHSVAENLGRKFVAHLIGSKPAKQSSTSPKVYPINDEEQSIESLGVRDSGARNIKVKKPRRSKLEKSLTKIAKMKNECDDMLLLFDANLNSWSVRNLFENIAYVDRITKNHKQVLKAINDPPNFTQKSDEETEEKDVKELVDESVDEDVPETPQHIRFYPTDNRLSAIMATSLTEYTNQLYFSELTQRVEDLEKKIQ